MSSDLCSACGAENPSAAAYCATCGVALAVDSTLPPAAGPGHAGDAEIAEMLGLGILGSNEEALIGEQISHFEIESLLGKGGMGRVYLARDIQLGRPVALKFLSESLTADPEAQERFLREARSASALDHPNIGTIYEASEFEGVLYIAMAYYDGETLRDRLKRGRVPLDEVLSILRQVSAGLAAAHEASIIHRDIKPGNVMITRTGQIKILDFGLAKPVQRANDLDTGLTVTGATIGTVAYMSPEQARGTPVDERTDIWSLGVVAYELFSGHRPFAAPETVAMLSRILTEAPPPLDRPDLPDALPALVDRMLQKDRDERIGSAAEVEGLLAAVVAGEAPTIIDPGSDRTASASTGTDAANESVAPEPRPSRVPPWVWIGVAATLIVIAFVFREDAVAFIKEIVGGDTTPSPPTAVVVTDFANTTGNPALAGTLGRALSGSLRDSPHLEALTPAQLQATLEQMERPADEPVTREVGLEICERHGLPAMTTGSIASLGSNYILTLDAIECATGESVAARQVEVGSQEAVLNALGEAAADLARDLVDSLSGIESFDPLEPATTDSLEALRAFSTGMSQRDTDGDVAAIGFFERALELDPDFAQAQARLGSSYASVGREKEGRDLITRASELVDGVSERERFYIRQQYFGTVVGDQRKTTEICAQWARTFEEDAEPSINLASRYRALGQYERSLDAASAATELAPDSKYAWQNLAQTQTAMRRLDEARATVASMEESQIGAESLPSLRARIAMAAGDEETVRRELAAYDGMASEGFETAALGWFLAGRGRLAEARSLMRQAVTMCEGSAKRPCATYARLGLAEALIDFGHLEEAGELVAEALEALSAETITDVKGAAAWSAVLLARVGQLDRAGELMTDLADAWPQDTAIQEGFVPIFEAIASLREANPQGAVESLEIARPYGRPEILQARGTSYLELGRPDLAVAEFERLAALSTVYDSIHVQNLAPLWLARAQLANGEVEAARQSYERFFALMSEADEGLPLIEAARAEYEALQV